MKKQTKKILTLSIIIFSVIGLVTLVLLFSGFFQSFVSARLSCHGDWNVGSYDINANTITIPFSVSTSTTCLSPNAVMTNLNVNDKNFCLGFMEGTWNDEFSYCILTSESWFDNKQIISNIGSCTESCRVSRGCAVNFPSGAVRDQPYAVSFDGSAVSMSSPIGDSSMPIACSGTFVIGYKEILTTLYRFEDNICKSVSILPSEKTSNDYTTLTECQNKIVVDEPEVIINDTEPQTENGETLPAKSNINLFVFIISGAIAVIFIIVTTIIVIKSRKKRR